MWQALHTELQPHGLTVVTVALDTDIEAARPSHDDAAPTHPALADPSLSLVDQFGMTNVPFGMWIDERGTIVRPAEPAFTPPPEEAMAGSQRPSDVANVPPEQLALYATIIESIGDRNRYVDGVRDWVANGSASRFVMAEADVIDRSRPRPLEHAEAVAEFELAQYLHRSGLSDAAAPHFERAHRLDPQNWSYVRQALSLGDDSIPKVMAEIAAIGADTFYPPLDLG